MTRRCSQALIPNTSVRDAWRRLPHDSAVSPAAIRPPGVVPPPTLARLQICRWWATDSLSKAIYVSEQVWIRWCSTGAYYTAKLTFSHNFPKFGVRIIQLCVLYSNSYGTWNTIKLITIITRHKASTSTRWHFTFRLCCHSNETSVSIANPPNSAQLEGTPTIPPSYIWVHAVVWAWGEGQTHMTPFCSGMDWNTDFSDAVTVVLFEHAMKLNLC